MNPSQPYTPSFEAPPPSSKGRGGELPSLPETAPLPAGPPAATPAPVPTLPNPGMAAQLPIPPAPHPAPASAHPAVADDIDLIEKEWVLKAKEIVHRTRTDPHNQNKEMNRFKADYLKKRYNKDVKLSEN